MLAALEQITDSALTQLSPDALLSELLDRISLILGADTTAILLLDETHRVLEARAAKGIEEEVERGVRIPVGRGFAGRIAREQRPVFLPDVDHADIMNPILREKRIRSMLGVPMLVEGEVIGVLHIGSLTPRVFTDDETTILQRAADRAALAIDKARLYEQRRLAETLQRSLLPDRLVELPGIGSAARYIPASERISGDWYDVLTLGSGAIGIAIGDVVGHGVHAATLMAQLRAAMRAYALDEPSPSSVLERLNRFVQRIADGRTATVCFIVFDPETGAARVASAGHLPSIVQPDDGESRFVERPPALPLGAGHDTAYDEGEFELNPGETLVLYTDGLIEDPAETLDEGLTRLSRAVNRLREVPLEPLCDRLLDVLVGRRERRDDIALLLFRFLRLGSSLQVTLPADPESSPLVRRLLARWLRQHGANEDEVYDLLVASSEAAANAIEHAYSPGTATFEIAANVDDDTIVVTVCDKGHWREPRGRERGRGIGLMKALIESVDVQSSPDGTKVTLVHPLARAAA